MLRLPKLKHILIDQSYHNSLYFPTAAVKIAYCNNDNKICYMYYHYAVNALVKDTVGYYIFFSSFRKEILNLYKTVLP